MVELKNITVGFNNHNILDGLNLNINGGEILSVIGMSGTGKSVLLKTILGLIPHQNGQIIFDGVDISNFTEEEYDYKVRNKMSMVFQAGALLDSLTIEQNIKLALIHRKDLSNDIKHKMALESLEMVGLSGVDSKYPEELSGGMIKRAAIARGVVSKPKYLFYDEPTTGLDPVLSNLINNLIHKLSRELNITSMLITHDIKGAEKFSDRIAMLYKGKIILTCPAGEIWRQSNETFNNFIHGNVEFK